MANAIHQRAKDANAMARISLYLLCFVISLYNRFTINEACGVSPTNIKIEYKPITPNTYSTIKILLRFGKFPYPDKTNQLFKKFLMSPRPTFEISFFEAYIQAFLAILTLHTGWSCSIFFLRHLWHFLTLPNDFTQPVRPISCMHETLSLRAAFPWGLPWYGNWQALFFLQGRFFPLLDAHFSTS